MSRIPRHKDNTGVYPLRSNAIPKEEAFGTPEEEVLGVVGDCPPLLDCTDADCFCYKVESTYFAPWNSNRQVYYFRVFKPEEYEGTVLKMFVRDAGWKRVPVGAKLWKVARVAHPNLKRGTRITKGLFLKKLFRCRLNATSGPAPYTVVAMLLKKLAG